ncbi:uncharacterized protein [Diabrotica undecimpunctata]|uniref:uncharacterized protein isoform X1 n=1 Tax=Diabrotica undecimpunctata TaxID=50387 RepID=UPI003B637B00
MSRPNTNCFQVLPNDSRWLSKQDSGFFPKCHTDYYVFNMGRQEVLVEGWWGTKLGWIGVLDGVNLAPGNGYRIVVSDKPYYVTSVKITNRTHVRALVHCSELSGYPLRDQGTENIRPDINSIAKYFIPFGVGKISEINMDFKSLENFFWSKGGESVWDKITKQITFLLNEATQKRIQQILREDILHVKDNLNILQTQIKTFQPSVVKAEFFIQLAEQLVFLEKKFSDCGDSDINLNFYLLPLYTATVNFKVILYTIACKRHREVGLNDEQIGRILQFSEKLIDDPYLGAVAHITKTFEDKFHLEYRTCDQELIYNILATVRTWCGINGEEYVPFWRALLDKKQKNVYNDVITYSTYFGRPSPQLYYQLVTDDVSPPLQPRKINEKRNVMNGIYVYIWRTATNEGAPKIGGLKIMYQNGDSVETGKATGESNYMDLKKAFLKKVIVWGGEGINCIEFYLSNGKVQYFGTKEGSPNSAKFKLLGHKIVGLCMKTDIPGSNGQAVNIAVAFQVLEKHEH